MPKLTDGQLAILGGISRRSFWIDESKAIDAALARIAELEESVKRRDRFPADLSQEDAVAISGFQDFLAIRAVNKRPRDRVVELKVRIAELDARPDPPAPAIVIRDRMQWADDRMAESEADGDDSGRKAWHGYGLALRWVLGTVDLGASPRPAAIDPDMPRRFRHKFYESDPWKYGVFLPCDWVFVAGGGQSYFYANRDGKSIFPYIEWIDEPPAEKGACDDSR